jgi:archaellum component FlaC
MLKNNLICKNVDTAGLTAPLGSINELNSDKINTTRLECDELVVNGNTFEVSASGEASQTYNLSSFVVGNCEDLAELVMFGNCNTTPESGDFTSKITFVQDNMKPYDPNMGYNYFMGAKNHLRWSEFVIAERIEGIDKTLMKFTREIEQSPAVGADSFNDYCRIEVPLKVPDLIIGNSSISDVYATKELYATITYVDTQLANLPASGLQESDLPNKDLTIGTVRSQLYYVDGIGTEHQDLQDMKRSASGTTGTTENPVQIPIDDMVDRLFNYFKTKLDAVDVDQIELRVSTVETTASDLNAKVVLMNDDLNYVLPKFMDASSQITTHQTKIDTLETNVSTLESEIDSVSAFVGTIPSLYLKKTDNTINTSSFKIQHANNISNIKFYPRDFPEPSGSVFLYGGITITGLTNIEHPLIAWNQWSGGGGASTGDQVYFYCQNEKVMELTNDPNPNTCILYGDLGTSTKKVTNIYSNNIVSDSLSLNGVTVTPSDYLTKDEISNYLKDTGSSSLGVTIGNGTMAKLTLDGHVSPGDDLNDANEKRTEIVFMIDENTTNGTSNYFSLSTVDPQVGAGIFKLSNSTSDLLTFTPGFVTPDGSPNSDLAVTDAIFTTNVRAPEMYVNAQSLKTFISNTNEKITKILDALQLIIYKINGEHPGTATTGFWPGAQTLVDQAKAL